MRESEGHLRVLGLISSVLGLALSGTTVAASDAALHALAFTAFGEAQKESGANGTLVFHPPAGLVFHPPAYG
jgi:hypothetical protein